MKLQYPKWLKDLVLPFENPDHPLYADPTAIQQREAEQQRIQNLSDDELNDELDGFSDEEMMEILTKPNHSDTFRDD